MKIQSRIIFLLFMFTWACSSVDVPVDTASTPPSDVGDCCPPDITIVDEGTTADSQIVEEVVEPPVDSGIEACSPQTIMTEDGCQDCDQVISNVSQEIIVFANNARVCSSDDDCETVIPQTGCRGYCSMVIASNQKGLFLEVIAELSSAYCSDPELATKCGYMTPSCGPTTAVCKDGLCEQQPYLECNTPNPSGCLVDTDCAETEFCSFKNEPCLPSACVCDTTEGTWVCTDDCTGECLPASPGGACEGENPQGCISTGCPDGEVCDQSKGSKPTGCFCSEITDPPNWNCTKDDIGGICVPE